MIIIKTPEEIETLREGGKRLATVLHKVKEKVVPGVSTYELDQYAEKLIREYGDTPAFLNYQPEGASTPFPASLCVSVNNEVVHGIPSKNKIMAKQNKAYSHAARPASGASKRLHSQAAANKAIKKKPPI